MSILRDAARAFMPYPDAEVAHAASGPLAGQAKDMGSAAVLVALAMAALCWAVIAVPLIVPRLLLALG